MRPRVALLAHRLAVPEPTGIARYVVEVIRALAALPHGGPGADPPLRYEAAGLTEEGAPTWLPPAVGHRTVRGARKALTASWCLTGRPLVDRSLAWPDLVHALYPWAPTPSRAPLVVTIHDLMPLDHPDWYGRKERWSNRHGLQFAIDHARRIVTVSRWVADQVVALGVEAERVSVVHNGVPGEFGAGRVPLRAVEAACARHGLASGRYLVAVGSVSHRKNLSPVLRALSKLDRIAPAGAPDLCIAGPDGVGAGQVRAEVERLGLTDRVRFAGFVDPAELPLLVRGSRALVHPSLDEGFGLTPLEAMAAGVPALASDHGSLPEVVGDGGVLVDPTDVDAWAAGIERAGAPEERQLLVERGYRRAALFSWERTAGELEVVYRQLIGAEVAVDHGEQGRTPSQPRRNPADVGREGRLDEGLRWGGAR